MPTQRPSQTRTRNGCLPCRNRRRKCDERRPRCHDCELRGYFCQWGLNVSFHPSRTKTLSSDDREALSAIEKDRTSSDIAEGNQPRPGFSEASFRDDTPSIISDYHILTDVSSPDILASSNRQSAETPPQNENWKPQPGLGATQHTPNPPNGLGFMLNDPPSPTDEHVSTFHNDGMANSLQLNDLHENPEAREETVRQPNDHSRSCEVPSRLGIYDLPFSLGHAISWDDVPLPQPLCPITKVEGARLISLYLRETGEWCETTDSDKHFTIQSIHEMMESDCFVAAAMALASRQRDAVQRDHRPVTLELYQYAIQLLLRQDPDTADRSILATCTLLCVYEMLASSVWEWRRHLRGCAGLLRTRNWNGSSHGIVKSCFWAFARIDVWAAFVSSNMTLMPTPSWVDDSSIQSLAAKGNMDDYCNLAILHFARIVNLLATVKSSSQSNKSTEYPYSQEFKELWSELQTWRELRSKSICPLLNEERTSENPFPAIVFSQSNAICGNTFYHAGSILLLRTGCIGLRITTSDGQKEDPVWHARELCGISTSNISHENWVNHLQPLFIAGEVFSNKLQGSPYTSPAVGTARWTDPTLITPGSYLTSKTMDEVEMFAAEKVALLKHLARIERETGWDTSARASNLRSLWGLG